VTDHRPGHTKDTAPNRDDRSVPAQGRRPYAKPRLIEYGTVGKLTQTGGVTTRDFGSMRRMCL
jgi:hypothetical protein